jgi:RNA polymerase sigma-70 factor (ECF subfamily)
MIKVCYRYTNDAEQAGSMYNDAMLKVFKHLHNYQEEGKVMGWIKRIVINTCIDVVRKKMPLSTVAITENIEAHFAIEEEALQKISYTEIQNLINKLPKNSAVVFNLYVYEQYNHTEIGELLQIPSGTSRYYLSEARRLLKDKVANPFYSLNKQPSNA